MIPGSTQSTEDRILWILTNNDGKMERSRLRRRTGMKLADLNLILEELTRKNLDLQVEEEVDPRPVSVFPRLIKRDSLVVDK